MRKLVLAGVAIACAASLAACDPSTKVTDDQVSQAVSTVQQTAVKVCGYLPAVQTVTGILSTFLSSTAPYIESANAIANGICGAVTPKSASLRRVAGPPKYRGVVIEGKFVK